MIFYKITINIKQIRNKYKGYLAWINTFFFERFKTLHFLEGIKRIKMKWTLILKAKKIVLLDEFQGGIFRGNKKK